MRLLRWIFVHGQIKVSGPFPSAGTTSGDLVGF